MTRQETGQGKWKTDIWNIVTWNVRRLRGKEHELIQECKTEKLDILCITETKKKEKGVAHIGYKNLLICNGVPLEIRANADVGLIISGEWQDG